jgi:superfamily II DNA or RNA helicase
MVVAHARRFVGQGLQTLILVREIDHGRNLLALLRSEGVAAEFIRGLGLAAEARKDVLDRFRAGTLQCLVASEILDEAIDLPNLDALLLAGGGKSEIQTVQRIGRGMRTGKRALVLSVVDFADLTHRYLARHSLRRLQTYQLAGSVKIYYRGEEIPTAQEQDR